MKKGYMMIACCALLTGLGSCATDDALNGGGNENGLTDVGTNYLAFNIVSDAGGEAPAPRVGRERMRSRRKTRMISMWALTQSRR